MSASQITMRDPHEQCKVARGNTGSGFDAHVQVSAGASSGSLQSLPETKGDRYPTLSERRNIVVIADEAHRSQYDMIDGFARHMRDAFPNASFIGFTGTPIELGDKNTRGVFGDYIDIYDIQKTVEDGATVPIYYESLIAKLDLDESLASTFDPEFDEITEGEEEAKKEKLKSKWAALKAVVGAESRIKLIAADLVAHWEKRLEVKREKSFGRGQAEAART